MHAISSICWKTNTSNNESELIPTLKTINNNCHQLEMKRKLIINQLQYDLYNNRRYTQTNYSF